MKEEILKIIGILIIILGLLFVSCLLVLKIITESQFVIIFLAFIITGFLIYKMDEIIEFKTRWVELTTIKKEVYVKAEEVKRLSEEVNKDKQKLREVIKVFIESFYLTVQTRNVFPIPGSIAKEIEKNLDILANFAVEDETERKKWIDNIQRALTKNLSQ